MERKGKCPFATTCKHQRPECMESKGGMPQSNILVPSQKQKAKSITYDPPKKESTTISHNKQCSQKRVGGTPLYVYMPYKHHDQTTLKYISDKHRLTKHMNLTMYGLCPSIPTYWVNGHARTLSQTNSL